MQSAVQWLLNRIEDVDNTPKIWEQIKIQAKEMEKQQHGNTWDSAIEQFCKRGGNLSRASCDFDDYFDETYGSKGSGMSEKPTSI